MVHAGIILLLLGQLVTDLLSRESSLHLRNGETKNYSEADRQAELAIVDTTDPGPTRWWRFRSPRLTRRNDIQPPGAAF